MPLRKRVVYVEDDDFFGKTIVNLLTAAGYDAVLVSDGESALKTITTAPRPDLVLLDLLIPKIDGKDLLRRIKGDPATKSIPVFVLSNLSASEDMQEAQSLGAAKFFVKALTLPTAVARTVEETLGH